MKLSKQTIEVLDVVKNFGFIKVHDKSFISACNYSRNVVCTYQVGDEFPVDFDMYEPKHFAKAIKSYPDVDVQFTKDFIRLSKNDNVEIDLLYRYSKLINDDIPSVDIEPKFTFTLPFSELKKLPILGDKLVMNTVKLFSTKGSDEVKMLCFNKYHKENHSYVTDISKIDKDIEFNINFDLTDLDALRTSLKQDYVVGLDDEMKIAKFTSSISEIYIASVVV